MSRLILQSVTIKIPLMVNERPFYFRLTTRDYYHFITGLLFVFSLLVIIGKIANADVWQALDFGGKVLVIVMKSVAWGVFGV